MAVVLVTSDWSCGAIAADQEKNYITREEETRLPGAVADTRRSRRRQTDSSSSVGAAVSGAEDGEGGSFIRRSSWLGGTIRRHQTKTKTIIKLLPLAINYASSAFCCIIVITLPSINFARHDH